MLLESTGVIGQACASSVFVIVLSLPSSLHGLQRIKMPELLAAVPSLVSGLESSLEAANAAATAICTTDLVRKATAIEAMVGGRPVRVGGMCKGSGMIHPNMATMLSARPIARCPHFGL